MDNDVLAYRVLLEKRKEKELRKSEFEGLDSYFKNEYNKVSV